MNSIVCDQLDILSSNVIIKVKKIRKAPMRNMFRYIVLPWKGSKKLGKPKLCSQHERHTRMAQASDGSEIKKKEEKKIEKKTYFKK